MPFKSDPGWDEVYRQQVESLPWYHPFLDPDLEKAIINLKIGKGSFLDIGTGPGSQAIELDRMGFEVTALDISETAIEKAVNKGSKVHFIHGDILTIKFNRTFDYAFDRGCFHVIDPPYRDVYIDQIHTLINPGGFLFLKTFSILGGANHRGPYQFSPLEIRDLFAGNFEIISCHETIYQGQLDTPPNALFSILKRI